MDLFEYAEKEAKVKDGHEPSERIYSVSELTSEIKRLLVGTFGQQKIWIKGEVSNYRGRNQSGHMYFRLKDSAALIPCVFFRGHNARLKFDLEEGMEVLVGAKLDLWEKGGSYQLIVEDVKADGQGELYIKYEQLKKKLEKMGYFDPERKKALPTHPKRIGVITSSTGSVVRDIIEVVKSRSPSTEIWIFPVRVQGESAASEINATLEKINTVDQGDLDLIILGRGGGSIEDLWPFNEEVVAQAIYHSKIPIISAVGHQTDFTIADFVADQRAATPSQAAEMAVPNDREIDLRIDALFQNIKREWGHIYQKRRERFMYLAKNRVLTDPYLLISSKAQTLDMMRDKIEGRLKQQTQTLRRSLEQSYIKLKGIGPHLLPERKMAFQKAIEKLSLLNPLDILKRGYSVTHLAKGKKIVKSYQDVEVGEELNIRLSEGALVCQVTSTEKNF